jgi:hypothetical protein
VNVLVTDGFEYWLAEYESVLDDRLWISESGDVRTLEPGQWWAALPAMPGPQEPQAEHADTRGEDTP